MIINGRKIGNKYKPYIIAELSANHGGSIDRAKKTILQAYKCGADAVKIQTYTPDTMTINCAKPDFRINQGLWAGKTLYDLYESAYTPYEWHAELFSFANKIGITLFSTPFDETAVDLLEELNTPAYKIASFELTDLPLIQYVAKKNKPMFLSTGMGALNEIADAIATVREYSQSKLILFHCISSYPTPTEQSNLLNINYLQKKFDVDVGLSDHSVSNLAATVAVGIGAIAIEKHFKLDAAECGPDSTFSLLPEQLTQLVQDCSKAWLAKGAEGFFRAPSETDNKIFRRSLYFVKNLQKGEVLQKSDIRKIRPGYGIPPKYIADCVGKTLIKEVELGEPVTWDCFKI